VIHSTLSRHPTSATQLPAQPVSPLRSSCPGIPVLAPTAPAFGQTLMPAFQSSVTHQPLHLPAHHGTASLPHPQCVTVCPAAATPSTLFKAVTPAPRFPPRAAFQLPSSWVGTPLLAALRALASGQTPTSVSQSSATLLPLPLQVMEFLPHLLFRMA
jgi:hypothetical protein